MQAFYSDHFVLPLPAGHRFPMAKYQLLREALQRTLPGVRVTGATAASDGELAFVHHPDYVDAIASGSVPAEVLRDIGFPWSLAMAERARRSVGASLQAARAAMQEGIAGNLAGGTHHAYADRGAGFCVFNDLAVSARVLQAEWGRLPDAQGVRRAPLQVAIITQADGVREVPLARRGKAVGERRDHRHRRGQHAIQAELLLTEIPEGDPRRNQTDHDRHAHACVRQAGVDEEF